MKLAAFLLPLSLLAIAIPGAAAGVGDDPAYPAFLTELQRDVASDRRAAVVALVDFPLRVNGPGGRTRVYRDARSVRRDYARIFTPRVRRAILGQRFTELFQRDQGVMIGDGEIWFDHICLDRACARPGPVRIRAINR